VKKIKLAIFDLDGVITSTTEEHFKAWTLLFIKHFGIRLDQNLEVYTKGVSRIESFKVLLKHSRVDLDDMKLIECLANEKNVIYKDLISEFDETKICPGVLDILNYLKQNNVKIALGSASKNAPYLIRNLKLEDYFDYIVDPTHKRSKPSPDIFLDAVYHFGYNPEEVIAFEDAEAGIKAIKNANIFAIGVGDEDLKDADIKLRSLKNLEIPILESIIRGN
jgi:beta-phosphoglucomutase